jgi:hypothetical protein
MNHFLMASLDFAEYRREMLERFGASDEIVDPEAARRTYSWDTPEVSRFKYLFNFVIDPAVRDRAVADLFEQRIAPEKQFARELYVSWEEAAAMQDAGMRIGGHTQWHRPLAVLSGAELASDLAACKRLLEERLRPQALWPFSYPYGKQSSFNTAAIAELKRLDFSCAFTTEAGPNRPGVSRFEIRRVDCKQAPSLSPEVTAAAV